MKSARALLADLVRAEGPKVDEEELPPGLGLLMEWIEDYEGDHPWILAIQARHQKDPLSLLPAEDLWSAHRLRQELTGVRRPSSLDDPRRLGIRPPGSRRRSR